MTMSKELKPLKSYKLKATKQGHYPIILDRDPVFAARALTKKDVKKVYNLLKDTFEEIKVNNIYHEPLVETILFSQENFLWFSAFLKEMESILGIEESEIPFCECPSEEGIEAPVIYHPFYPQAASPWVKLSSYKILSKKLPPINNYRIKYIMENYDMSDFIEDCYPSWYLLQETTIFEQYSERTNTRVRVDFKNGELHYFIAGASDNWQQITEVPLEMDHVISALIFRSYSDNY